MASSNGEYCIEKMRVVMGSPRDSKLKMAVFITQIELAKSQYIVMNETSDPTDTRNKGLPNGQSLR